MASKEEEEIELLVIGVAPGIKQELIECYFDSQDLGVISVTLPEQGKAVVKLTGLKDIESFCAKTHKIKNSVVKIEPICKQTDTLDDINADTIEVMCDPGMDTNMVEIYFQGPKSGGGRDKVVETIRTVEPGKYHVKFESKEDVDVILAKESHAIMKKPITVCRLIPPPVKPPEPEQDHIDDDKSPTPQQLYELNKLFIDNIPDDTSEDLLTAFLDGRLDLDHEENDYTVTLKHPQALVNFTNQYSIEELKEFCKKLTSRKLKGQLITAELCKINCTILISNIGNESFSNQDSLQIYFESKRSGGGDDVVDSIVMLGSNRAKVTFKNSTVVTSVLSKQHHKLGPDVMLVPATPLQDDTSDSSDESIAKDKKLGAESQVPDSKSNVSTPEIIRKPVVLPLDPVIAKYLHKKSDILDGLSKEIFMTVSIDNENAILQPNDSSPPDYAESNVKQFQYLLSAIVSKVDIYIPSEIASNIYPIVMQKCTSENMEFAFNGDRLSIAGESRSVTDLQMAVQELSKRLIQTTEEVKLELEDYQFVTNCKRKEIEKKHQGIKLVFNTEDCTLSVSGSILDVSQFKETLPTLACHAKVPVNLVGLPVEFLYKDRGAGILTTLIDNNPVFPFFSTIPHSLSLSLLCSQDAAQMVEQIALKISDVIIEKEFMFSPYFFSNVADSSQFSDFKQRMSKTYAYISILEGNRFKLACRKEILPKLSQLFEKFVAEECSITDKVMFKKGVWRLLNSVMEKRWCDMNEEMAKKEVSLVHSSKESAQRPFVKIKGEREMVADMKAKIIQLQSSVKEERVTLSRPGLLQYFVKDPNGKCVLTGLESEAKVCIELEITKDEKDFNNSNTHTGANFKRVCFANMKGGATINVSIGDITQFNKAEVIVNAANEDLAHGAGVAGAISDCGGQIITKDSDDYTRKYGKVHTGSAVIFHRVGNLPPPYKAIVHAVGPRWNSFSDNEKEIALLRKTVKMSLKVSRDYSSIAIPAISSGVYGFPPDVSANTLVKTVVEYFDGDPSANMSDIHFVILKDNVDVFIKAIKANFETVHTFNDNPPPVTSTPIKPQPTSDVPTKSLHTGRRASTKPKTSLTTSVDTSIPVTPKPVTPKLSLMKYMKITNGDILNHQCEVLVNTTDQQLSFGGFVGRILLKAAGQGLEDECKSIIAKQPDIQHGDVVTTRAHQLNSKHIVHVVLPGYSGVQSETTLRSVIKKCLQECTRLKAKSISIPSVGAGNLGYPGDTVAMCLLEETLNYLTINEGKTSLQQIHFVIFDANIHQAFQAQLTQISNPSASPSTSPSMSPSIRSTKVMSSDSRVPRPIVKGSSSKSTAEKNNPRSSQPDHNVVVPSSNDDSCSFSLPNGGVLQLIQGDITIEQTDVIVNTTNPELRLGGSGVSGALLRKGGGSLQAACDTLRAQNIKAAEGKVVETRCEGMGQLQCKSIFHIVFDGKDQRKLLKTILACLDRAEKMKYTSIALPAIGTGNVAYPTALAAEGIVKALKQFIQRKPNHVKKIRMVIFMPQMFKQFTEAFKKIEENDPGILSLIYDKGTKFLQSVEDFFTPNFDDDSGDESMEWSGLEDDVRRDIPDKEDEEEDCNDFNDLIANSSLDSEVTMCIYGESEQAVKRADKRLKAIIETQFINEDVDDSNIIELPQSALDSLTALAHERNVDIDIDIDPAIHTIKLHGCHNDVMKVKDKVRDLLAKVNEWKTKEEAAATVYKHVQWVRQLSNEQKEAYSECLSYEIEKAFRQEKPIYRYDGDDEHFKIDFSKSEETDLDSGGVVKVQRVDFSEVEKPPKWASMPKDSNGRELTVHLVALKQSDPEYKDAQAKFDVTMRLQSHYSQIVTIQRIQNPVLYGQYMARKKEMEKRNPPGWQNERMLFHGTKPHVVENINTQGFNRSFKHVTMYGQGAYFARDALYSHGYAPPDANQYRRMYLTRVLTGEFTVGVQTMLVPPPKNNQLNKHVLYDSTVDNPTNPSIFVVYTDPQSYAAYLITYK